MQCTLKIAPDTSIDTAELQLSDCTVQTEAGLCAAVWSFGAVTLKWCVSANKLTGSGDSGPWREAAVTGPFCLNKRKILIFLFLCKACTHTMSVPDTFIKINFIYSAFFHIIFAGHVIILNVYLFSMCPYLWRLYVTFLNHEESVRGAESPPSICCLYSEVFWKKITVGELWKTYSRVLLRQKLYVVPVLWLAVTQQPSTGCSSL